MPGNNVLLDTNIAIALFNKEPKAIDGVKGVEALYVSAVTLGELYFGAMKSTLVEQNLAKISDFIRSELVIDCNADTARAYGEIKALLRRLGRPVPDNDVWIAAVAIQHDLPLATRDSHFDNIEHLTVFRL